MAASTMAFLAHLLQPLNHLFKPAPGESSQNDPSGALSDALPDLCTFESNPWVKASASAALGWIQGDLMVSRFLPVVAQISLSLRGLAQAFASMCGVSATMLRILNVFENTLIQKLEASTSAMGELDLLFAENTDLKRKLQDLSADYGRQETLIADIEKKRRSEARVLEKVTEHWHKEEEISASLATGARLEITALRELLADERRANADLVKALNALLSSGADSSTLERFLIERAPELQREAYIDAKSTLLKKILAKYPDADMDYFSDMADIPNDIN